MDIFNLILSVNKIALIIFIITGFFVFYQLYLLKKETSVKTKPKIPEFKEGTRLVNYSKVIIKNPEKKSAKKVSVIPLIVALIVFIFLGTILLVNFLSLQKEESSEAKVAPTPIINFITSAGIKIYNQEWIELTDEQLKELAPGQTIYVGIETVADEDIDKARIKINKKQWEEDDVTVRFNKEKNVFYREYLIATDEAFLKIEGQLHSKVDGWLGD